ncbi:MAG: hypothetical protein AVDCRST_MAG93-7329, partial [uncultured Chloroflexia bacterium]
ARHITAERHTGRCRPVLEGDAPRGRGGRGDPSESHGELRPLAHPAGVRRV